MWFRDNIKIQLKKHFLHYTTSLDKPKDVRSSQRPRATPPSHAPSCSRRRPQNCPGICSLTNINPWNWPTGRTMEQSLGMSWWHTKKNMTKKYKESLCNTTCTHFSFTAHFNRNLHLQQTLLFRVVVLSRFVRLQRFYWKMPGAPCGPLTSPWICGQRFSWNPPCLWAADGTPLQCLVSSCGLPNRRAKWADRAASHDFSDRPCQRHPSPGHITKLYKGGKYSCLHVHLIFLVVYTSIRLQTTYWLEKTG